MEEKRVIDVAVKKKPNWQNKNKSSCHWQRKRQRRWHFSVQFKFLIRFSISLNLMQPQTPPICTSLQQYACLCSVYTFFFWHVLVFLYVCIALCKLYRCMCFQLLQKNLRAIRVSFALLENKLNKNYSVKYTFFVWIETDR